MKQRRTLLFYTHALAGGGAERVLARLASGFAERGDRVLFAVDFEAPENLAYLAPSIELRLLPPGHVGSALALAKLLRQERPAASLSAISVSNLKHAVAARLAGRSNRALLSYHGFCESESQRLSNIGYRLTPLLARTTAGLIAVSQALRDDLVNRFRTPAELVRTIYNPAAPDPFPAPLSRAALEARAPVIITIGRLAPDKDFLTLIRALAKLEQKDARLVILGEGPERARLKQEAQTLGVEARVEMPGFVSDVAGALASAKCFVLSSLRETFSLACAEALAHGLPAVATDCGGPREIISNAAIGDITPVGDAAALATAIDRRLRDPGDPAPRQARAQDFSLETALVAYDFAFQAVERGS